MNVDLETVRSNFQKFHVLDENSVFVEGFFADCLPKQNVKALALLRLDGDMYDSTMSVLAVMYRKLTSGSFCIVDDYKLESAKQAVHDYLAAHRLKPQINPIDEWGVYWRV